MRNVLAFVAAAVTSWAVLTFVVGDDSRRESPRTSPSSSAAPGSPAPGVSGPRLPARPPRPRLAFAVDAPASESHGTTLEALALRDPWTTDNLRQAIDAVLPRLVQQAWSRNDRRDPACAGEVLMLAARVDARQEEVTLTLDADDACVRAYFSGHATVRDHEVGGPFPVTQLVVPYPVPRALSARLPIAP